MKISLIVVMKNFCGNFVGSFPSHRVRFHFPGYSSSKLARLCDGPAAMLRGSLIKGRFFVKTSVFQGELHKTAILAAGVVIQAKHNNFGRPSLDSQRRKPMDTGHLLVIMPSFFMTMAVACCLESVPM